MGASNYNFMMWWFTTGDAAWTPGGVVSASDVQTWLKAPAVDPSEAPEFSQGWMLLLPTTAPADTPLPGSLTLLGTSYYALTFTEGSQNWMQAGNITPTALLDELPTTGPVANTPLSYSKSYLLLLPNTLAGGDPTQDLTTLLEP